MQHRSATTRRRHAARRGALTLALLLLTAIGILMAAVALDWAYLTLVQRAMQQRTDALALAGAPELLDEHLLYDADATPRRDQRDDARHAQAAADEWRALNNRAAAGRFRLDLADLQMNPGCVADVAQTGSPNFFDAHWPLEGAGPMHNAFQVGAVRRPSGRNPVGRLLGQFAGLGAVEVSARSVAALDNRVIGFQPTADAAAPVVPLAIDITTWNGPHGQDRNGNGVRELTVRLRSTQTSATPPNAAAVSFYGGFDLATALRQTTHGAAPGDLPAPDHWLGPATAAAPLPLAGTQRLTTAQTNGLLARFQSLATAQTVRAYPLYTAQGASGSRFPVVGFVAARVTRAQVAEGRLSLELEPAYLIHFTAWTAPAGDPIGPTANPYIHKLRLVR